MAPNTSVNSLIANLGKLNGSNYHDWVFDIEMVARRAGTWEVLVGEEERPVKSEEMNERVEWDRKNNDALTMIGLTVERSELSYIRGCTTAYAMWKGLADVYSRSSRANRIALRQQLQTTTLGEEDSVQDYVTRVSDVSTRLRALGVGLSDEDEVDVLIMNLPDTWGHVASSLMIRPGDLKVKDVVAVLLEEETRRQHTDTRAGIAAFAARASGRKGKTGGSGKAGSGAGGASTPLEDQRTCYRCGQPGHVVANCPIPPLSGPTLHTTESAKVAVAGGWNDGEGAGAGYNRIYHL
ncbi:hypothetical protein FRC09_011718 [Ceratobasidium sp. 395]|nr:hypothetical protein FRC09_011718 [Ceratobasidium sp. 395]